MIRDRATLEAHIKAHPVSGAPKKMRATFDRLAQAVTPERQTALGGVPCGVFGNGPPFLWLHGGGYVFGSSHSHAHMAAALARLCRHQVVVPDYRRAPEHKWPACLDNALAVWETLGTDTPVGGDSAGGHLALNLALFRDVSPRALILVSPNTDRTGRSDTRVANSGSDLMNDHADDAALAHMAMGTFDPERSDVSPILADLSGLPPTYLTASNAEVLFGDALLLRAALRTAQVPCVFDEVAGLFHMWPLWPQATPEAQATLTAIGAFLEGTYRSTKG